MACELQCSEQCFLLTKLNNMSIKKIKENNTQQFVVDLKRVTECLVITEKSNAYLTVMKKQVKKEAETIKINYRLSTDIYRVGRLVMVIL